MDLRAFISSAKNSIGTFVSNNKNLVFWLSLGLVVFASIFILILKISSGDKVSPTGGTVANLLFLKLAFAGLIIGTVKSRENTKLSIGLAISALLVLLVIMGKIDILMGAPLYGVVSGIWIMIIGGLTVAAVISRKRPYLAWTFCGLSLLVFFVLIGKLDSLFSWAILGLPIFAALGIFGSIKTEGAIKTFLSFTSGIVIIFWMYLFYQDHPIENLGFIQKEFFFDDANKSIFLVFMTVLGFAIWKKSKIFYGIAIIIFLSFLGNTVVNNIAERFPEKLTPPSSLKIPNVIKDGFNYVERGLNQSISSSKERLLKKDAYMYKYDGTNFTKSAIVEAANIKVFLLGETVQKDGLSFEKVRFNDPATGEEFWIYAGDLLTSTQVSTETLAPIQTTVKGGGQPPTQAVVEARDLVGEFPINLVGNILNIASGKNGERQGTGEVFIPHLCEAGYRYFITISGEYEKLFWNPPFKKMPWTGNDRLVGQGVHKPFPNLQYGAVTLRIGDQDGLVPKDKNGFVDVTINAPSKIFVELNINREIGDYMLNGTSKVRNSTLSLKIERRPI